MDDHLEFFESNTKLNRKYKDSVFTDLFSDKKYLIRLYRSLFPEDTTSTEEDLKIITLKNVFTIAPYNDLGFCVKDKFIILVEAQSTWNINILMRVFLYLAITYRMYLKSTKQDIFGADCLHLPKPRPFVIYTGKRIDIPEQLSLTRDIINDPEGILDVKVKVICEKNATDINAEYISFCKILDGMVKEYGPRPWVLKEALKICKTRNILKEYLEENNEEVAKMLEDLFDKEVIEAEHREALARKSKEEGMKKGREEGREELKEEMIEKLLPDYIDYMDGKGASAEELIQKVMEKFSLSEKEAKDRISDCKLK